MAISPQNNFKKLYFILVNCMGWQVWQCQITALKIRKIIKLVGYILCWVSKLYQFVSHGSSLHTFVWNLKRLDMVWLIHAIAQATKHAQHEQQAYVQLVPAVIIECVKYHWYRLTFVTIRAWKSRQIFWTSNHINARRHTASTLSFMMSLF